MLLPPHHPGQWSVWQHGREEDVAESELPKRLRRWRPQSLLLVAAPDDERYRVPTEVENLSPIIALDLLRRSRVSVCIAAAFALVCLAAWIMLPSRVLLVGAFSALISAIMVVFETSCSVRAPALLDERTRFLYWFIEVGRGRSGAVFWSAAMVVIAGAQLLLMGAFGGNDATFARVGAMYDSIDQGDWWRIVTGAYLHYSILHFLNNAFLLMLVGSLSWATFGRGYSIGVFVLGNMLGVLGQMWLGGSAYNSTGGISFGIYALFGFVIVAGRNVTGRLPTGFAALVAFIAVLCIGASELASKSTATVGHLFGVLAGALCGCAYDWLERRSIGKVSPPAWGK